MTKEEIDELIGQNILDGNRRTTAAKVREVLYELNGKPQGGSTSNDISNESTVTGATATDAFNNLDSNLSTLEDEVGDLSVVVDGKANTTYVDTQDTATLNSAKAYAEGLVVGLWDDRGSFDASVNAYPSSGGSGTAGAIKKGDIWTISVAGTLPASQVVEVGDTVRALVDTPGNTQANWSIQQNNIGYVAENAANKTNTISGNETSTTLYANVKGVVDWVNSLFLKISGGTLTGALNEATIVNVASASTINLTGINANTINITGTTTISTITGVSGGGIRRFIFNGTLTIGHNTSTILCPNNTNLIVNSGDVVDFVLTTTGALKVINYAPFIPIILKDGGTGGYYSNYPLNIGGFNSDAFITLFGQADNDATKPVQIGRKSATTSGRTVVKIVGANNGGANGLWMSLFDSAHSSNPRYFNVWNCDGGGVIIGATTGSNNVNDINQTLQVFKSGVKIVDNSGVGATVTAPSDSVFNAVSTTKGIRFTEYTFTAMNALTGMTNGVKVTVVEGTNKDGIYIYNSTYSMFLSANYIMNQYVSSFQRSIGFSTQTPVANTIYGMTIRIEQDIIVTKMGCFVVGSSGSDTWYLDIYDMSNNRLTGGTLTPSTATEEMFCTVAWVMLKAQTEYKLAFRSNGTTATFAQRTGFGSSSTRLSWTASGVSGASPSTLPTVSNSAIQPFISLGTA